MTESGQVIGGTDQMAPVGRHAGLLSADAWTTGRLTAGLGLAAAAIAVQYHVWVDIFRIAWRDEEASHIWLVPPVVLWLVLARRDQIARCRVQISPAGPIIMALGWAVSWYGFHHAMQSLWHGGVVIVAVGAFLTVTGLDVVRRFWPAFLVLVFLIPVPAMVRLRIAGPMQEATAAVTTFLAQLVGMGVERNGAQMRYNGVDVAVAEACNGMRMIFALVLVSFAFAFSMPLRTWVRVLIILLSPLSAIICNVIRLVPTLYVYGYYPEATAERFHDATGWVMVVVALLLLMGLVRLLQWLYLPVYLDEPPPGDEPGTTPNSMAGST